MGGRTSSRPTMSLLAFQDIITSVSGILMFIVLMLSLELSSEAPPPTASPADSTAEVARLESAITELRRDQLRLEHSLSENSDVADAAASVAPEQLRTEIRDLDQSIDALQSAIKDLESRRNALLAEKRSADQGDAAAARADSEAATQTLQQAARLAKELHEIQSDERPIFSLPRGFNKSGWIVVVSAEHCEVAPLGRPARPRTFPITSGGFLSDVPDVSAFLEWSRSQGTDQYFLLIVRPSGAKAFAVIQDQFEASGVAFGFDLASPGRRLLDPVRGASQ